MPALRQPHTPDGPVPRLPKQPFLPGRHPVGGCPSTSACAGGPRPQVSGTESTCRATWRPSRPALATWAAPCGGYCARAPASGPASSARIQPIPAFGQSIWPARPSPLARGLAHQGAQHALAGGAFTRRKMGERVGCVSLSFERLGGGTRALARRRDDHRSDFGGLRQSSSSGRCKAGLGTDSHTSHFPPALLNAPEESRWFGGREHEAADSDAQPR